MRVTAVMTTATLLLLLLLALGVAGALLVGMVLTALWLLAGDVPTYE